MKVLVPGGAGSLGHRWRTITAAAVRAVADRGESLEPSLLS